MDDGHQEVSRAKRTGRNRPIRELASFCELRITSNSIMAPVSMPSALTFELLGKCSVGDT
jgi:hypothetical protein